MSSRELSYGQLVIHQEEVLGSGAYGLVCKAWYGQLPCAAKLPHSCLLEYGDSQGVGNLMEIFQRECQFLSTIRHPNIVQYLGTTVITTTTTSSSSSSSSSTSSSSSMDTVTTADSARPVLLMELMDENLTKFLERSPGPLPYHTQLNICLDVAQALAYLHSNAITHRDLSSNNVLLIGHGSRAKVTDFGMSKLMDANLQMSPLVRVPGTPAYMPPEALATPPDYSSRLDCFSHGVLSLQVITRKFPTPGEARRPISDPRYPPGQLSRIVPEAERRKEHIDLIDPAHPLLPAALRCLASSEQERPSAEELCHGLTSLREEAPYARSMEEARDIAGGGGSSSAMTLQSLRLALEESEGAGRRATERLRGELTEAEATLAQVLELLHGKERRVRELEATVASLRQEVQRASMLKLIWKDGTPPPMTTAAEQDFSSACGTTVSRGKVAYFTHKFAVHAYNLMENKWSRLPQCRFKDFALVLLKEQLTIVGGVDSGGIISGVVLSYSVSTFGTSWKKSLPQMRTGRARPAAIGTATHLVVAGGHHHGNVLSTVEVLDVRNLQWSLASPLPQSLSSPQMVLLGPDRLYLLSEDNKTFSCTLSGIVDSCAADAAAQAGGGLPCIWSRKASVPLPRHSTLVVLRGRLVAVGGATTTTPTTPEGDNGKDRDSSASIHCYDDTTKSWGIIGEMMSPASRVLAAVLESQELVVVGGVSPSGVCRTKILAQWGGE